MERTVTKGAPWITEPDDAEKQPLLSGTGKDLLGGLRQRPVALNGVRHWTQGLVSEGKEGKGAARGKSQKSPKSPKSPKNKALNDAGQPQQGTAPDQPERVQPAVEHD